MIIRPISKLGLDFKETKEESERKMLHYYTGIDVKNSDINVSFDKYYRSNVFCDTSQLEEVSQNVDVVVFCGYAGAGHFASAYAIAKSISDDGYDVMLVDVFRMFIPKTAKMANDMWLFTSRYAQKLFLLSCNKVSTQKGIDQTYSFFKKVDISKLTTFLKNKNVKVGISTYIYPNVIAGYLADYVGHMAIVATDHSAVGILAGLSGISFEKVSVLVPDIQTFEDAKIMYPSIRNCKEVIKIGGVASEMTIEKIALLKKQRINPNILTYFIGGGLGIGYGINSVKEVFNTYEKGPIVIVCGDNPSWVRKIKNMAQKYTKDIVVLGYILPDIAHSLMVNSKIVIAKAGGITSAEVIALDGVKIFHGSISGHEEKQANLFAKQNVATNCKSKKELIEAIKSPINTPSIYTKKIVKSSPVSFVSKWVREKIK
jgi:UDP-N-acetylglucosamine:LPS N-acetylglucosamine transferase